MSCYSNIPEDIILGILGHLCQERPTLRACAVTSSIFLFPSQSYLFSHVIISGGSQCRNFHRVLSSNPHLAAHVRHLTIKDSQDGTHSNLGWIIPEMTLPFVLGSLPLLRSFYLHCSGVDEGDIVPWRCFPKSLTASLFHLLKIPTLEKVEFRAIDIPISSFFDSQQIKRLHLPGCSLDGSFQIVEQPCKTLLEQLSITSETYSSGLVDTLSLAFDISHLRELIVLGPNTEMLKAAGDIIKTSALSLERFQWSLPYFYNSTGA